MHADRPRRPVAVAAELAAEVADFRRELARRRLELSDAALASLLGAALIAGALFDVAEALREELPDEMPPGDEWKA